VISFVPVLTTFEPILKALLAVAKIGSSLKSNHHNQN
jgi:hypothetical protein